MTGVQTCALPISKTPKPHLRALFLYNIIMESPQPTDSLTLYYVKFIEVLTYVETIIKVNPEAPLKETAEVLGEYEGIPLS